MKIGSVTYVLETPTKNLFVVYAMRSFLVRTVSTVFQTQNASLTSIKTPYKVKLVLGLLPSVEVECALCFLSRKVSTVLSISCSNIRRVKDPVLFQGKSVLLNQELLMLFERLYQKCIWKEANSHCQA
mmetsp:Transcript_30402/g.61891  ORF Transcript_30402/g.61891 Transcript_30402/m.61891 type:complete len:128 (-) Transcript_30402:932-1315(-)